MTIDNIADAHYWNRNRRLQAILVVSFRSNLIRAFSMFLEDPLSIISETWRAGKDRFGQKAQKLSKNRWFFLKDKIVLGIWSYAENSH
jgi:hypothetical protein